MTIGTAAPVGAGPRTATADAVIAALHARADEIRRAELMRTRGRWDTLSEADRNRLEALTANLVDALVGELTGLLRLGSGADAAHLSGARYLLGLDPEPDAA